MPEQARGMIASLKSQALSFEISDQERKKATKKLKLEERKREKELEFIKQQEKEQTKMEVDWDPELDEL